MLVIGGGTDKEAALLADVFSLPFPVLADPLRTVYSYYGLEKVLGVYQRSGVVLVDQSGIVRYIQRSLLPTSSLDTAELLAELAHLRSAEETSPKLHG